MSASKSSKPQASIENTVFASAIELTEAATSDLALLSGDTENTVFAEGVAAAVNLAKSNANRALESVQGASYRAEVAVALLTTATFHTDNTLLAISKSNSLSEAMRNAIREAFPSVETKKDGSPKSHPAWNGAFVAINTALRVLTALVKGKTISTKAQSYTGFAGIRLLIASPKAVSTCDKALAAKAENIALAEETRTSEYEDAVLLYMVYSSDQRARDWHKSGWDIEDVREELGAAGFDALAYEVLKQGGLADDVRASDEARAVRLSKANDVAFALRILRSLDDTARNELLSKL
jgi:hypothetical protein